MTLGRVVGSIVATRKDPRLEGHPLLIVKPVTPDGQEQPGYQIAVDTVGAGNRELVFTVAGSSARMASGCQDQPVDCVIVGIVDGLSVEPDPPPRALRRFRPGARHGSGAAATRPVRTRAAA